MDQKLKTLFMQAVSWENIETIFNQTLLLPLDRRRDFVVSVCKNNEALFQEVITLIGEAENNLDFLSDPVFNLGTKLLAFDPVGLLNEPDFASYQLLSVLGRGGTGVVFLAKDKNSERCVALKILPFSLAENDDRILRFQREAKAASSISHPNFAQIYESGKAKDRFYIAMEYVAGKTLREILKTENITVVDAVGITVQIARALLFAHQSEIIHRDIKPENIMMTDNQTVKILDFGLAIMSDSDSLQANLNADISVQTSPGLIIGTVSYMSPEQVRGQPLDKRTDLWSLGIVLFEMLAGKRPFTGETPSDIQASILLTEPDVPPHLKRQAVIKQILIKLLAKKVEDRYRDAAELLNDLTTFQKHLFEQISQ